MGGWLLSFSFCGNATLSHPHCGSRFYFQDNAILTDVFNLPINATGSNYPVSFIQLLGQLLLLLCFWRCGLIMRKYITPKINTRKIIVVHGLPPSPSGAPVGAQLPRNIAVTSNPTINPRLKILFFFTFSSSVQLELFNSTLPCNDQGLVFSIFTFTNCPR